MILLVLIVSVLFVSTGLWTIDYGRNLPTGDQDVNRDQSFFNEFLYGPPGYERVRALVVGVVLIVMGVFGIVYAFLSLILR